MTYSALIVSLVRVHARVPVCEHSVDRRVKDSDIALDIDGIGARTPLQSIQPAVPIRVGFCQRHVLPEATVLAQKGTRAGREHRANGLQSLDRPNVVPDGDI